MFHMCIVYAILTYRIGASGNQGRSPYHFGDMRRPEPNLSATADIPCLESARSEGRVGGVVEAERADVLLHHRRAESAGFSLDTKPTR